MENVDQLFQLIHSLSKSEKRYFKIYSSLQSGNKKYIALFDLIEKQNQYDEKKLKSRLKITAFAAAKVYLYNLILKSLRLQGQSDNRKKQVLEFIENAENLLAKGLFDQSYKQLMKAKKIAQKFQHFPLLIDIYQVEYVIAGLSENAHLRKELHRKENQEFHEVVAALNEQFDYRKAINLIAYKSQQNGHVVRSEQEKKTMEKLLMPLLRRDPETCLSFKAKTFHCNMRANYHFNNNENEEAYRYNKMAIDHLTSDSDLLSQEIANYIVMMNNLLNCLVQMERFDEMIGTLDKMKALRVESPVQQARIFAFIASRQIIHYRVTRQYQKGVDYIAELKKQFPAHESKLEYPAFFVLCSNIQEFYFIYENFKQALYWNNRILHHPEIKLHYDFYSNARLAEIILHYELDNLDTFQSFVKSFEISLKTSPVKGEFEPAFLNFFKQLLKATDPKKRKEVFILFSERLKELSHNPYEKGIFLFIDLQDWIQSRIEGKKIFEISRASS